MTARHRPLRVLIGRPDIGPADAIAWPYGRPCPPEIAAHRCHILEENVLELDGFEAATGGPCDSLRELQSEVAEFAGAVIFGWTDHKLRPAEHWGQLKLFAEIPSEVTMRFRDAILNGVQEGDSRYSAMERFPEGARLYRLLAMRSSYAFRTTPPSDGHSSKTARAVREFVKEARTALVEYRAEYYSRKAQTLLEQHESLLAPESSVPTL